MKVGILLTDHVMDEFQIRHGDMSDFYKFIFNEVDPTISLKIFDVVKNEYPEEINECAGYLITGSRESVYDQIDWIETLKKFIFRLHTKKKPLIGICFGHQLIAQVLGGSAEEAKVGWTVGNQIYEFKKNVPWSENNISSVKLLHSHKDQVTKLPVDAQLIASTKKVPIAMFHIGNHILSHQGHPEFTSEYVFDVATKRRNMLGEETYLEAVNNLQNTSPDNRIVAKWWVDFLRFNNQ